MTPVFVEPYVPPDSPLSLPPGLWDVAVIGAGAAGLWAAGSCAARGRRTLLLEKNRRPGVKILASGGGRCNLTTTLPPSGVLDAFGRAGGRFLGPALRALDPMGLRAAFGELGVATHDEALEKVFPDSQRARDVVEALISRAAAAGVTLMTGAAVIAIERQGTGLLVRTQRGDISVPNVVVSVGGKSYPKTGTTGDGYPWMESLGHTVTPLSPALAPLVVPAPWVAALRGIDVPDARVFVEQDGKVIADRRRPLLFTHTGLSGPGPMDVSRWFDRAAPWHKPSLLIDFVPSRTDGQVRDELLTAIAANPSEKIARLLPGELPARLLEALCTFAGVAPAKRATETSKAERHALVATLKRCTLHVEGTRGFDFAEVTAGGVALEEVDPGTMRSRLVPGLFVVGEILDMDGPIGGFNFQAAFSTAELAGRNA